MRGKLYELLINVVPPELIMRQLTAELLKKLDDEVKHQARAPSCVKCRAAPCWAQFSCASQDRDVSACGARAHTPSTCKAPRVYRECLAGRQSLRLLRMAVHAFLRCDGTEQSVSRALSVQVIQWAAFYEHRLQEGSKAVFHIEAFVAKTMAIYKAWALAAFA